MAKILHTADLHLKKYQGERWNTLVDLIELGNKENISHFIISGDLFDKNFEANKLRPKIREVFSKGEFDVILLSGNHDQDAYKQKFDFGENVKVLSEEKNKIEYEDFDIYGLPFNAISKEKLLNQLRSLNKKTNPKKNNILLYHGELLDSFFSRGEFGDEGDKRYMPVKLSYFKDLNFNYILAGHFHTRFDSRKIDKDTYFIYPGSPVSITKKETGKRKVNIFKIGEAPQPKKLNTPYFKEINVTLSYKDKNPLEIIKDSFKDVESNAKVLFEVDGFIDSEKIGKSEKELLKEIREIVKEKTYEFKEPTIKDISEVLNSDLFLSFKKKLDKKDYSKEKKEKLSNLLIKGMTELEI